MSETQFHFFTGENVYLLESEVRRWKQAFFRKHGQENFMEIVAKDASLSELMDAVSVMPFIAERRLVVIRGLPKLEKEELHAFAEAIHPQTVVLLSESKPDKRLGVTKEMMKVAQVQEFPFLAPGELESWGRGVAEACGSSISRDAWRKLVGIVGEDQWMLDSELRKLAAFAGASIEPHHVDEIAVPSGEQVIWRFTDLIGGKKPLEAIAFLRSRIERGEDPYGLWVIFMNMVKNVVLVWSGLQSGLRDERSVASAFGMHFLSVRGLLPLARSLDEETVSSLLTFVTESDLALKTGGFHYTAERPHEVLAVMERGILHCA